MDVVVWTRYPDQRHAQCRSMHFRMPTELELSIGDLPGSIRTVCVSGGFVVSLLLYKTSMYVYHPDRASLDVFG